MVVKKVKYKPTTKPKAWRINDLVDYIRNPHESNALEKIEHSGSREFFSSTHDCQKMEMIALANESIHSKMPVAHWIFSWQEHEQPTPEQVDELVDIFLERMGLVGHQVIYGLHYDTENYHLHIAVNRTHPETCKVIQPHKGFDIEVGHKIVAEIEHRQGWSREENGRYRVDDSGQIVRAPQPESGPKPRPEALDFEAHTGEKSAQRIAQERGHAVIKEAVSWPELHQKLAAVGLRFVKKGSGALVIVGDIPVKASSVDRAFSMGNLCKRLGEFEPGDYADEAEPIAPEPVSPAHAEDWREYRAERDKALAEQPESQHPARRTELKTQHKLERKRLARRLAGNPLPIINRARHGLAVKQRDERRALAAERPRIGQRRQSFKAWLKAHGRSRQADSWRYRNRTLPPVPSPSSPLITNPAEALIAYAVHREVLHRQNARLAALAAGMAFFCKVLTPPPESSSRQDARAALLLRAEGHSREAVAEAIRHYAPEWHGEEKRDWRRYAARTTAYAFGLGGDLELARMPRIEPKPIEAPPLPVEPAQAEPEREAPRLRMR